MNIFLVKFSGHYLGGEMLIAEETQRKAFNKAKKQLDAMGLEAKNKDLSMEDVQMIDCQKTQVLVIDDGNY